jgi:hypothetical protein
MLAGLLQTAASYGNDLAELKSRITSFDDPKITIQDLAFLLVTHNFDAAPMGDCVELESNGTIYKLTPNGDNPGLCDISPPI